MAKQAPMQKARTPNASTKLNAPVATVISIDDLDLDPWMAFAESTDREDLRFVSTASTALEYLEGVGARAHVLILLHIGGVTEFARRVVEALTELPGISNPAILFVALSQDLLPGGAVQSTTLPGLKVRLREVPRALEAITEAFKREELTPLRSFAPQLRRALRAGNSAQESFAPAVQSADSAIDDEESPSTFPFDELRQREFTELAWQILEVARRLGQARPRPETSARRLLTAILLAGLRKGTDEHSGYWLVSQIPLERNEILGKISARYPAVALYKNFDAILKSQSNRSEFMTEKLDATLQVARRLASEAVPEKPSLIGLRHLLGAALLHSSQNTSIHKLFRDYLLNVDSLREQLIAQLPVWGLHDDVNAWRNVLEPVDVDVELRLPVYAADSAAGPDLIGIKREVEAMASLVCAWSIEPPLSIGLFGEWGSGKSFFMQKMKERVKQIAIEARKSNQPQRDFGYYKNIVQIEFNAWHYVEGNLWASLVEHIFSNLRFEGTAEEDLDSEQNIKDRLEKMLELVRKRASEADAKDEELAQRKSEADEAEAAANAAAREAEEMKASADQAALESAAAFEVAKQKHADAQTTAEIRRTMLLEDTVESVKLSDDFRAEVKSGLGKLGIASEHLQTVQGIREALKEASDSGKVIAEGFGLLRSNSGFLLLLWVIAIPLGVAAVGFLFDLISRSSETEGLKGIGSTLSGFLGLVSGALASWKKLSPQLGKIAETVNAMKAKRAELDAKIEAERKRRAEESAKVEQDVVALQQEAAKQQQESADKAAEAIKARLDAENKRAEAERVAKEAAEKRALADATEKEADALRPERRIATFIQDRAAAKDYRQHLGVPALIRRDFEKLAAMFETQRKAEEERLDCGPGNQRNDPTIVNRIILYIDDLDRCPPGKVVDVLRAIHLLLAFRLFVVVVAVDARWMKRSLKDQFSLMLTGETHPPRTNGTEVEPRENIAWRATASPDDYLEKIFQVPFWVRPLTSKGSEQLVLALTRHDFENLPDAPGAMIAEKFASSERSPPVAMKGGTTRLLGFDALDGIPGATNGNSAVAAPEGVGNNGASSAPALPDWTPVKPDPRTLMLTQEERDYMVSLSAIVGRSPRSVKRYVNCYRLLKSTMPPADMARSMRSGSFRASMLLLAIVTGFPEAAPALLARLRDSPRDQSPEDWSRQAAQQLKLEQRGKWAELQPAIDRLREWGVKNIGPLADSARHVDRFSFSPVQRPVEELV